MTTQWMVWRMVMDNDITSAIIAILLCWPVALVILVLKRYDMIQNEEWLADWIMYLSFSAPYIAVAYSVFKRIRGKYK